MNVLNELLDSLRLSGGIIMEGRARGAWCIQSQVQPEDVARLSPGLGPVIAYHYVQTGVVFVRTEGEQPVSATAGSILLFPHNDRHQIYTVASDQPVDAREIVTVGAGGVARIELGGEGPEAEFLSGFLVVTNGEHPMLDALPKLLAVDVTQAQDAWVDGNVKLMKGARQAPEAVAQVAQRAFRHGVEAYVARLRPNEGGWLRGLQDPAVAKALAVIHARFAEDVELEDLAGEAGVSRSVLGERFIELLGEPPMRYCTKWRMRIAANMLRDGQENSANIAYAVGFNSEAAFNRAFKREFGDPPMTWKRRLSEKVEPAGKASPAEEEATRLAAAVRAQRTGTCLSKDGTSIGYSEIGSGFPTHMPAVWYHRMLDDWSSPVWRHWLGEAIKSRRLIRSDLRGAGLSERHPTRWTFDALYEDFEAVADEIGAETFDILAFSHSANIGLAYAARHPERVRKLIVVGGYARGYAVRGDEAEIRRRESLIEFARNYKAGDGGVFAQMLGSMYWPGARGETVDWFGERLTTIMDLDEEIMNVFRGVDISAELASVRAETLVMHSRHDRVIACGCSEEIAKGVMDARYVPLDSENHVIIGTEPAWEVARPALRAFLDSGTASVPAFPHESSHPPERRSFAAADGTAIAYEIVGNGFPLVRAPTWLTHLDLNDDSPIYRHWHAEGSRGRRFVHGDMRGFGLSQLDPPELSFAAIAGDFAAMIDDAGIEQCDLIGMTHGAAWAIDYAAKHPGRVRKLILVSGFAAGWLVRADPEEVAWRQSLMEMNRREWAFRRSRFGDAYITLFFPDASRDVINWHNDHFDAFGPTANINAMSDLSSRIDVRGQLAKVRAKTLVFHSKEDAAAPLAAGREMAAGIEGARLIELSGANHVMLADEPAWPVLKRELRAFLTD